MFLAIDECFEGSKKILGGVLSPVNEVSVLEKDFTDLRIKNKLFGEIKWNHIKQRYVDRYCEFIDLFFNNKSLSYHSICYSEDKKYQAAYVLIRNITWKLQNFGICEPILILFDNDNDIGSKETRKIREIADKDPRIKAKIEFCSQGVSHVLGILQIADLLTGCVNYEANSVFSSSGKGHFYEYVRQKNGGGLIFNSPTLPRLSDHKIHYLDPNNIPRPASRNSIGQFDGLIEIPKKTTVSKLLELNRLLKSNTGTNKVGIILPNGKQVTIPYLVNYDQVLVSRIKELFER